MKKLVTAEKAFEKKKIDKLRWRGVGGGFRVSLESLGREFGSWAERSRVRQWGSTRRARLIGSHGRK